MRSHSDLLFTILHALRSQAGVLTGHAWGHVQVGGAHSNGGPPGGDPVEAKFGCHGGWEAPGGSRCATDPASQCSGNTAEHTMLLHRNVLTMEKTTQRLGSRGP